MISDEMARRKSDHIELALKAQSNAFDVDPRFNYEPLFYSHLPQSWEVSFLKHQLGLPLWISSMTGGTQHARSINENLAKLAGKYKLGMGLGSCRSLIEGQERLEDFNVRKLIGAQPLFGNLGIAQVEQLEANKIHSMVKQLEATGLIIHLNPLQEWFQPEGDRYAKSPLETLMRFLENCPYPVIVKEVGQGMGPKSLRALLELPIAGIEFGAFGGTNFSLLERMRSEEISPKEPFIQVGHTALEMVEMLNALETKDKEFIISGGVKSVLDGYHLLQTLKAPGVIGQAQAFLSPAMKSFEELEKYFLDFREALVTAKGLLTVRGEQ